MRVRWLRFANSRSGPPLITLSGLASFCRDIKDDPLDFVLPIDGAKINFASGSRLFARKRALGRDMR